MKALLLKVFDYLYSSRNQDSLSACYLLQVCFCVPETTLKAMSTFPRIHNDVCQRVCYTIIYSLFLIIIVHEDDVEETALPNLEFEKKKLLLQSNTLLGFIGLLRRDFNTLFGTKLMLNVDFMNDMKPVVLT